VTKHVYIDQPWSLPDTFRHLSMFEPWTRERPPTHLIKFIGPNEHYSAPGVQVPVHDTIAQSFLAHLRRLPRSYGLTLLKEYDENGVGVPGTETLEGDIPFVTVVVPDTRMVLPLIYFIYHQDQEALLVHLCGDYSRPLFKNLSSTNQCCEIVDVRTAELRQSEKIAREVSPDNLANRIHDLYSLHRLGDQLGLSDDRFWNTITIAQRILLDAAGLQHTWETRREVRLRRELVMREEAEEKLRKENETEEKIVEDMLLEDDVEEMEVEAILLDDEDTIIEISDKEFYGCPRV
jgi:hypothetical protein